jgi:NB-ARC domain
VSEQQVNQTGFKDVSVGGNLTANLDQSVNKTIIHQAPKSNQPIPSNVRQGSKNFVGREDELADIHAKLQEGQDVIVCAVEGMGGVGKTELALQYATRYQQEYVARYWLSLREMGLAQAVVTMASPYLDLPEAMQAASLDEQAAWCWQNWLPETGKLLVILDDVPKAESIPDLAMPINPRVRVLVTTRERELNVGFESVPLKVLSEEKAKELLKKIVGAAKVDKELVTVKEICETLGYLPLGIELIGEYLSKNRFLTFAKLQERLNSKLQERLNFADESIARERKHRFYAHRGVEAAIQLSWDDISTGSQRVAMLLGLFAPVEILWELVAAIGAKAEITEDELNEARGQLDSLQPIDDECKFYKIHTLVREFFRYKLVISDSITKQNIYYLVLGIIKYDVVLAKSLVVSELEKFNPFFDNSIKSIDYARLIGESRRAWYEGFGGLTQIIGTTRPDGSLPKIGAYIYDSDEDPDSKNILCAEYCGEEYGEYFELTEEIVSLHRQEQSSILFEDKKFLSFSSSCGSKNLDIPLISEYDKLRRRLSEIIGKDCSLPTNTQALLYETAWNAAHRLTEKYKLRYFPLSISVHEIDNYLKRDSQLISSTVRPDKLTALQTVLNNLKSNNIEEFLYPWHTRYSEDPQEILNFVITVYRESLIGYQAIVERWFTKLSSQLETQNMLPVAIEGVVVISPDGRYSLDWYWIPLKKGNSNCVRFDLSKTPMTEDKISILLSNTRETTNQFISFSHYKSSHLFTPQFPVTHLVYGWLWNDLEKLNLVSGRFDPHIW